MLVFAAGAIYRDRARTTSQQEQQGDSRNTLDGCPAAAAVVRLRPIRASGFGQPARSRERLPRLVAASAHAPSPGGVPIRSTPDLRHPFDDPVLRSPVHLRGGR